MKMSKNAVLILSALCASIASAETPQEAAIKKTIEPRLGDNAKVDSVTQTPYSGLFEVRTGSDIIYTDKKAEFLFVGRILDAKTLRDITKERVDKLSQIKFSDLPLDAAIKSVKGDGKRVLAVFEDPNCGYCKRFRKTLSEMDNITVYTFMYNILSEESAVKSRNVWCSADKSKAWEDWMLNAKVPAAAAESCTSPNDKVFALGKKLKISGTPTVFFLDGSRIPGAVDAKGLDAKFAAIK
jgi:thiol:disulfide interchange protein DsbC